MIQVLYLILCTDVDNCQLSSSTSFHGIVLIHFIPDALLNTVRLFSSVIGPTDPHLSFKNTLIADSNSANPTNTLSSNPILVWPPSLDGLATNEAGYLSSPLRESLFHLQSRNSRDHSRETHAILLHGKNVGLLYVPDVHRVS